LPREKMAPEAVKIRDIYNVRPGAPILHPVPTP
jgi:hypothetical protein